VTIEWKKKREWETVAFPGRRTGLFHNGSGYRVSERHVRLLDDCRCVSGGFCSARLKYLDTAVSYSSTSSLDMDHKSDL
jgi:hypothetical protein